MAAQLLKVLVKKKKVICPGEPNVVVEFSGFIGIVIKDLDM